MNKKIYGLQKETVDASVFLSVLLGGKKKSLNIAFCHSSQRKQGSHQKMPTMHVIDQALHFCMDAVLRGQRFPTPLHLSNASIRYTKEACLSPLIVIQQSLPLSRRTNNWKGQQETRTTYCSWLSLCSRRTQKCTDIYPFRQTGKSKRKIKRKKKIRSQVSKVLKCFYFAK